MKADYSLIELRNNTILIALANIGSKAISFILAPLYSYYLTTEQFGIMDLIMTTCGLTVPLICLDIFESVFRFTKEGTYNHKTVISSSLFFFLAELLLCVFLVGGYAFFKPLTLPIMVCALSAILESFYNIIAQYARGQDKILKFAFSGLLNSFVLLGLNIVFLVVLNLELAGWMISFILAKIIIILYLCYTLKIWNDIAIEHFDAGFIKNALRFCLPLMPSATMWWIMNASDRYILSYYWGIAVTGIYAVATKLPVILSVFENVFYQAWQTTALSVLDDNKRDAFYSKVFNHYFRLLSIGIITVLAFLKPLLVYLFAKEYAEGWICSAILVLSVMIHALGGNIGILYTVFKNTNGALKTSFIGAVINIVLNLLFIPKYGMMAAACTTLFAYIVVLVIRWFDIKGVVNLSFSFKSEYPLVILTLVQLYFYYIPGTQSYIIRLLIVLFVFFMYRDMILKIAKLAIHKGKNNA